MIPKRVCKTIGKKQAYEGCKAAIPVSRIPDLGTMLVLLPKPDRKIKWKFEWTIHTRRNEIEQAFLKLIGCRSVSARFEKLDSRYLAYGKFALIVDMVKLKLQNDFAHDSCLRDGRSETYQFPVKLRARSVALLRNSASSS